MTIRVTPLDRHVAEARSFSFTKRIEPCFASGMSISGRGSLWVLVAAWLAMPGCAEHACTLIGGEDGMYVTVGVTGGTLAPGEYTAFARVDDVEVTADGMILPSGGGTQALAETVVGGKHLVLDGFLLNNGGVIAVRFREGSGPAKVTIGIRRDAALLAQDTYEPTYSEYLPNGEGCGPELELARGDLSLTAP